MPLLSVAGVREVIKSVTLRLEKGEELTAKLLPEGVRDGDLLLKAVVRRLLGDADSARAKTQAAEIKNKKLHIEVIKLEGHVADLEEERKRLAKDLDTSLRRICDFETKVAYLGPTQWKELTQEVNDMLIADMDPHTKAKKCYHEMLLEREKVFGHEIVIRTQKREAACMKATLEDALALNEKWAKEIADKKNKEENQDAMAVALLSGALDEVQKELMQTKDELAKTLERVAKVTGERDTVQGRLLELETTLGKDARAALLMRRELTAANGKAQDAESVVKKSAQDKKELDTALQDANAETERLKLELEKTAQKLARADDHIGKLEKTLQESSTDLATQRKRYNEAEISLMQTSSKLKGKVVAFEGCQAEASLLKVSLTTIADTLNGTEKELAASQAEVQQLTAALKEAEIQLKSYAYETSKNGIALHRQQKELEEAKASSKTLTQKWAKTGSEIKVVRSELDGEKEKYEQALSLASKFRIDLEAAQGELVVAHELIQQQKEELEGYRAQLQQSTASARDIGAALAKETQAHNTALTNMRNAEYEVIRQESQIRSLLSTVERLTTENGTSQKSAEETSHLLSKTEADLWAARMEGKRLGAELQKSRDECAEAYEKHEQLLQELKSSTDQLYGSWDKLSVTKKDVYELSAQRKNLLKTSADRESHLSVLEGGYNKLASDFAALQTELAETQSYASRLSRDLKQSEEECAVFRKRLDISEETTEHLACELDLAREAARKETQKVYAFHAKEKQIKQQVEERRVELSQLNSTNKRVVESFAEVSMKKEELDAATQKLSNDLAEALSKVKSLEAKASTIDMDNTKLRRDLLRSQQRAQEAERLIKRMAAERTSRATEDMKHTNIIEEKQTMMKFLVDGVVEVEACTYCPKCGPVDVGSQFCTQCGERIREQRPASNASLGMRKSGTLPTISPLSMSRKGSNWALDRL